MGIFECSPAPFKLKLKIRPYINSVLVYLAYPNIHDIGRVYTYINMYNKLTSLSAVRKLPSVAKRKYVERFLKIEISFAWS